MSVKYAETHQASLDEAQAAYAEAEAVELGLTYDSEPVRAGFPTAPKLIMWGGLIVVAYYFADRIGGRI